MSQSTTNPSTTDAAPGDATEPEEEDIFARVRAFLIESGCDVDLPVQESKRKRGRIRKPKSVASV